MTDVVLVHYDGARQALVRARDIDEVRQIKSKAEALRQYARQAGDHDMARWASEIRVRAERRAGEMLIAMRESGELATHGGARTEARSPDAILTLRDLDLKPFQADRWLRVAEVPSDNFEAFIADCYAHNREINSSTVRNLIAKTAAKAKNPMAFTATVTYRLEALVEDGVRFGCIYGDPPWLYANQGTRAATGNHYGGMTVDQLCALPIGELSLPDAHLHLWTTNGFLFECPKIFAAWGFEFRSTFVWVKPQMGIGNYWRNSHEILLTAIRGKAKRFEDHGLKSWIEVERGKHSAKPEQVRHFIERASPGPRLELFGRNGADGWTVWGNEAEPDLLSHDARRLA